MSKKIIIYSYYSPEELTGIGKYNGELIKWLLNKDIDVISFSNAPFYPKWELYKSHVNSIYSKTIKGSLTDIRSWVYIPTSPSSLKKILSEFSFFLTSCMAMVLNVNTIRKSDAILVISPPFFIGILPVFFSKIFKIPLLNHIQDLQIDAAKELNLLPETVCDFLEFIEKMILKNSDFISTISAGMIDKLQSKKLNKPVGLIPNWADLNNIRPGESTSWLHSYIGISSDKSLIVYSGNIGEKQGLELIIETAALLQSNERLHFVILGEGLYKDRLEILIGERNLSNISLARLVSKTKLSQMLNDSFIQLVIQKSSAADSFLPSKLGNIMAAGCASIVTTEPGTSLYEILSESNGAYIVRPEEPKCLAEAIVFLEENDFERNEIKKSARAWSEKNFSIDQCLKPMLNYFKFQ